MCTVTEYINVRVFPLVWCYFFIGVYIYKFLELFVTRLLMTKLYVVDMLTDCVFLCLFSTCTKICVVLEDLHMFQTQMFPN